MTLGLNKSWSGGWKAHKTLWDSNFSEVFWGEKKSWEIWWSTSQVSMISFPLFMYFGMNACYTRKVQLDTWYGLLRVYLICVFFFSFRSDLYILGMSWLLFFCQYRSWDCFVNIYMLSDSKAKVCAGRRSGVVSVVWKFGCSFQRCFFCVSID